MSHFVPIIEVSLPNVRQQLHIGFAFCCVLYFSLFHENFKSICITHMIRNLILSKSIHFHIIAEPMYFKIRFNYRGKTDFWIKGFDDVTYNQSFLFNNTPAIS